MVFTAEDKLKLELDELKQTVNTLVLQIKEIKEENKVFNDKLEHVVNENKLFKERINKLETSNDEILDENKYLINKLEKHKLKIYDIVENTNLLQYIIQCVCASAFDRIKGINLLHLMSEADINFTKILKINNITYIKYNISSLDDSEIIISNNFQPINTKCKFISKFYPNNHIDNRYCVCIHLYFDIIKIDKYDDNIYKINIKINSKMIDFFERMLNRWAGLLFFNIESTASYDDNLLMKFIKDIEIIRQLELYQKDEWIYFNDPLNKYYNKKYFNPRMTMPVLVECL